MSSPPPFLIAVGQIAPRKANYRHNLGRLRDLFAQVDALDPRPSVLALPETALTGYFLEGGVHANALTAGTLLRDLDAAYRAAVPAPRVLDVTLGFYEIWNGRLHNSALYATLGGNEPLLRHVHRKLFLPTYGLFDEERFVDRGHELRAFDTAWGRAALLVCEDAWHSVTATLAALDGAQVVFVCAAPPARGAWPREDGLPGPATVARWDRLMREIADEHGVYVVLANLVGSEGSKTFAGASSIVGPRGDVRVRGPVWREALVTAPVDLADVTRARADMPLIAELETMIPHLRASLDRIVAGDPVRLHYDPAPPDPQRTTGRPDAVNRNPAGGTDGLAVVRADPDAAAGPPPLDLDPAVAEEWLVEFLRQEFGRRGFRQSIVGLSGGVDSAVAAALAVRALGPDNVLAVFMPYRTSSADSREHAELVAASLKIRTMTVDISDAVDAVLAHEPDADASRRGNVMARIRMIHLFDLSAKHGALPLGTGNKTERLLGYFTWHADDSPPINPLGDLFKTQVWALARHLNIPEEVVGKPPTADLVVGQTDEGDLGISYAKADEILNWMVSGYTDADLEARGFDGTDVELVRRRLEGTHWKRRLPTVPVMSQTAIGESYLRPVDY